MKRFSNTITTIAGAALSCAVFVSAQAQDTALPTREGPRPVTTDGVPHVQVGVEVVPEIAAELLRRVDDIPNVEIRDTVVSLPGAMGFWLEDDLPLARPEVIVGGREFAHMHPDGSLHASLDPEIARTAIEAGWAVAHPWANQRPGWEGFVMIYTPLSDDELDVVVQLVEGSYSYVTGRSLSDG
ncbi:MAG: luciferase family protein [Pseudomonadota bacterium]